MGQRPTKGAEVPMQTTGDAAAATTTVAGAGTTVRPTAAAGVSSTVAGAPTAGSAGAAASTTAPAKGGATTVVPAAAPAVDPMSKIPASGFFADKRPPQFVLISFDGAADPKLMARWRAAAESSQARLTFFLSAVYLLGKQNRTLYQGPGHAPGASAIGFSPTPQGEEDPAYITAVVRSLQDAAKAGNEVGNHFGGHWCGAGGVNSWTKADWATELNQVESVVLKVDENNKLAAAVGAPYDPLSVAGARTPCLEGKLDDLYPVLKARGYRYDASNTRSLFEWPVQRKGLWAFGFAGIPIAGLERPTIPVDFSISTGFNGAAVQGTLTTEQTNQISTAVRDAYAKTLDQLYYGARTPFDISNHFNSSDGDAYNKAVEDVVRTWCVKTEVVCATYSQVVGWLDAHAADLPAVTTGKFTKLAR